MGVLRAAELDDPELGAGSEYRSQSKRDVRREIGGVFPRVGCFDRKHRNRWARKRGEPLLPGEQRSGQRNGDYDREIALVALEEGKQTERILGVARVIGDPDGKKAEFAVLVGDPWQGRGVGAELLQKCLRIAKERGIETVWGIVLRENTQMLALARKLGFNVSRIDEPGELELTIDIGSLHFERLEEPKQIQDASSL